MSHVGSWSTSKRRSPHMGHVGSWGSSKLRLPHMSHVRSWGNATRGSPHMSHVCSWSTSKPRYRHMGHVGPLRSRVCGLGRGVCIHDTYTCLVGSTGVLVQRSKAAVVEGIPPLLYARPVGRGIRSPACGYFPRPCAQAVPDPRVVRGTELRLWRSNAQEVACEELEGKKR
eukprot:jgi/Botrbrau1/23481/Bobra.106_1s0033.1